MQPRYQGEPLEAREKLAEIFGTNVRRMRQQRNIKQDDMALCCGIDRMCLSQMERGKMCPNLWQAYSIAKYLNVQVDSLMEGDTTRLLRSIETHELLHLWAHCKDRQFVLAKLQAELALEADAAA